MFNDIRELGKIVVLLDGGFEYPGHFEWVEENCPPQYAKLWKEKRSKLFFTVGMKGMIMCQAPKHPKIKGEPSSDNPMLYGILTEAGGFHVVARDGFFLGDTFRLTDQEVEIKNRDRVYHSHNEWMGKYAREYADKWVNQICKFPMVGSRGRIVKVGPNDWSDKKETLFGILMEDGNFHIMNGEGINCVR